MGGEFRFFGVLSLIIGAGAVFMGRGLNDGALGAKGVPVIMAGPGLVCMGLFITI